MVHFLWRTQTYTIYFGNFSWIQSSLSTTLHPQKHYKTINLEQNCLFLVLVRFAGPTRCIKKNEESNKFQKNLSLRSVWRGAKMRVVWDTCTHGHTNMHACTHTHTCSTSSSSTLHDFWQSNFHPKAPLLALYSCSSLLSLQTPTIPFVLMIYISSLALSKIMESQAVLFI